MKTTSTILGWTAIITIIFTAGHLVYKSNNPKDNLSKEIITNAKLQKKSQTHLKIQAIDNSWNFIILYDHTKTIDLGDYVYSKDLGIENSMMRVTAVDNHRILIDTKEVDLSSLKPGSFLTFQRTKPL